MYEVIAKHIKAVISHDHKFLIIVLIDKALQTHRAEKRAKAFIDLINESDSDNAKTPSDDTKLIPPSPLSHAKQESPPKQAAVKQPAIV
jgi:hypothetical protein